MKYKSLIGNQKVKVTIDHNFCYEIWYNDSEIVIDTQKALEDAIKLGIIEEVKPKELWINIDGLDKVYKEGRYYQTKELAKESSYKGDKQVKFIEVIDAD